jgi:hypothetical protein
MAKGELIVIRVTAEMKHRFEVAAASSNLTLTTFLVRAAEAAAVVATKRQARARAVARPARRKSAGAVPTFFQALCVEARKGGGMGYEAVGRKLCCTAAELIDWDSSEERKEKFRELRALIRSGDDGGVLAWFNRELPKCMALIPRRRRALFLRGVFEAAAEDPVVLKL